MGGPCPPYQVKLAPEADSALKTLEAADPKKWKKVMKALKLLRSNPRHPGLGCHKWETLKKKAPDGGDVWTCYVENNTPSAWRVFFFYDSREKCLIYVVRIEPHS